MCKVSVIVPVYNVEKYLSDCIDSIIAQTYKNLEIILVDDGSTDNSPSICDEYAKKDDRIKVIHKQNGGVSSARNTALDIMTGDFVTFVDGDDLINIHFIEVLLGLCNDNKCDMSYCGYVRFPTDEEPELTVMPENEVNTYFAGYDAVNNFFAGWIRPNVCNKLFFAKLFEDIRFPIATRAEDLKVVFDILLQHKEITVSGLKKTPLYYYRLTPGSAMGKINLSSIDDLKVRWEIFNKLKVIPDGDDMRKSFAVQTKYFTLDFVLSCKSSVDAVEFKRLLKIWSKKLVKDMFLYTEKNPFKKLEYFIMYMSLDAWKFMRVLGWKLFKIPLYRG